MKNVIFGFSGTELSEKEREFFKESNPAGFILFKRNIESKEQVKKLTSHLKSLFPEREVLILIDQEGGRVQRITEPLTVKYPAAKYFLDLMEDIGIEAALKEVYITNLTIAKELSELGINVNCTPVADLHFDATHDVIGDRSYGTDPEIVIKFCIEVIKAHLDSGVQPIIKHIPGHGRATSDSHLELPVIDANLEELEKTDFHVFKMLSKYSPFAMTAHIKYLNLDADNPVTLSTKAIKYIRDQIGFTGKIISDCITMSALSGSMGDRAIAASKAGCDYVLYCSDDIDEMREIASVLQQQ